MEYRDMVYAENELRTLHLCLILYTIFANWQLQITSRLWFSEWSNDRLFHFDGCTKKSLNLCFVYLLLSEL